MDRRLRSYILNEAIAEAVTKGYPFNACPERERAEHRIKEERDKSPLTRSAAIKALFAKTNEPEGRLVLKLTVEVRETPDSSRPGNDRPESGKRSRLSDWCHYLLPRRAQGACSVAQFDQPGMPNSSWDESRHH